MPAVVTTPSPTDANAAEGDGQGLHAPGLQGFVFALFFIFGGITSLNDVIIPKLKALFTLTYFQATLVQLAFFAAYFFVSVPAALVVQRTGYMRSAVIGLVTMIAGCLLFVPASSSGQFIVFLGAMFVLGSGITIVQVVANPLISLLGNPKTASSRLTFAQAFNSLGTTIFPYVGAILILGALSKVDPKTLSGAALSAYRTTESQVVAHAYLGLAAALAVVAFVVWTQRNRLKEAVTEAPNPLAAFDLLKLPRFAYGMASIFLYVGAEVAIGSLIVNYLEQSNVFGLDAQAAGAHVPYYWGGALVGRFIGAAVLRVITPGKVLAGATVGSIALILVAANTTGAVSGWALLAIGLCNAIMFPTIFTLACEGLGHRTAEGSGLLCVAIVGGAIIPPLTGQLADHLGLRLALALPALCYVVIGGFGLFTARKALARA